MNYFKGGKNRGRKVEREIRSEKERERVRGREREVCLCCSDVVIQKAVVSFRGLRSALKLVFLSPPVAPVGSLHASRHQATVMERGEGETEIYRE